tara:strand:- start:654 stop:923 length:270 start_codon:yes stop_codon:yes gene_type:complete
MYKVLFLLFLSFSFKAFSCQLEGQSNILKIKDWLGNKSSFSKSFIRGKCALDEALEKLSISEKRVITNLIAKSYSQDAKKVKELINYNY